MKLMKIIEYIKKKLKLFMINTLAEKNLMLDKKCGKLKSKWKGPYVVEETYDHGAVMIKDPKSDHNFKQPESLDHRRKSRQRDSRSIATKIAERFAIKGSQSIE
ncbi:unnamed protein product [Spirodela intermedia]|uniref:Uncharacterized protein n=1 Tax=Spirodela intermedia TaxID=51605 RepID=A0A7I8KUQ4_SPIIN|nr:unnamed protein product [Spirodela intermedia]